MMVVVLGVGGAGLGAALAAVLRDSGVVLVTSPSHEQFDAPGRDLVPLLGDVFREPRARAQVWPVPAAPHVNLPKRAGWQFLARARAIHRSRERRTKPQR